MHVELAMRSNFDPDLVFRQSSCVEWADLGEMIDKRLSSDFHVASMLDYWAAFVGPLPGFTAGRKVSALHAVYHSHDQDHCGLPYWQVVVSEAVHLQREHTKYGKIA